MTSSGQNSQTKQEIKPWIRLFARIGYISKGTVYALLGILSAMAALGFGTEVTGTSGMLRSLAEIPLGEALLWLIGVGLSGYILWVVTQAVINPQKIGKDAKGTARRVLYGITAFLYTSIAFNAITIAIRARKNINYAEEPATAKLLAQTFGQWIVGLLGLVIIGFGIFEIYKGISEMFISKFKDEEMKKHEKTVAKFTGKLGLIARGIVFGLTGYFFIKAVMNARNGYPTGFDRALSELAQQPHGPWLLGITAAGLFLYGIYEIVKGKYKYMDLEG